MKFTIILSETKKVSVVDLSEYSEYKREQFNKLKKAGSNESKTFSTEQEAIDFMSENFPKSMIAEEYLKVTSLDGKYYFES